MNLVKNLVFVSILLLPLLTSCQSKHNQLILGNSRVTVKTPEEWKVSEKSNKGEFSYIKIQPKSGNVYNQKIDITIFDFGESDSLEFNHLYNDQIRKNRLIDTIYLQELEEFNGYPVLVTKVRKVFSSDYYYYYYYFVNDQIIIVVGRCSEGNDNKSRKIFEEFCRNINF